MINFHDVCRRAIYAHAEELANQDGVAVGPTHIIGAMNNLSTIMIQARDHLLSHGHEDLTEKKGQSMRQAGLQPLKIGDRVKTTNRDFPKGLVVEVGSDLITIEAVSKNGEALRSSFPRSALKIVPPKTKSEDPEPQTSDDLAGGGEGAEDAANPAANDEADDNSAEGSDENETSDQASSESTSAENSEDIGEETDKTDSR